MAQLFFGPSQSIKLCHARLRTILPAEPDRPPPDQVAHHDAVGMALADRDLVDADGLGPGPARADELGLHVLLLQRLDRIPVKPQLLGNVLDRGLSTAPADIVGKALRIERIVCQKIEPLALHLAATAGIAPAGPRSPGKSACRRTAGRAPAGSDGRTNPNEPVRNNRRSFFCAPIKTDDARLQISEDTPHRGQGTKTGERVGVQKPSRPPP